MRLLDRYVFRHFAVSLATCAATILGLYVVVDLFLRLEDFLQLEVGSPVLFLLEYYAYHVPGFFLLLLPVVGMAASMMAMIRLSRTHELTPMITAGVSALRILRPVLLSVAGLALVMGASEEWLLPALSRSLRDSERVLRANRVVHEKLLADTLDNKFVITRFDPNNSTLQTVTVTHLTPKYRPDRQARAKCARWIEGERAGWLLSDGVETRYDGEGKRVSQARFGADGLLVVSTLTPRDIEKVKDPLAYIPFEDLVDMARQDPYNASLRVRLHLRLTYPLYCVILFALGVPFVLRREVTNAFFGIGICVFISAIFFLIHFLLVDLGNLNILDPLLATWTPVVVFGSVGISLFDSIQT
ncbi:MAG: LptF/LptG family permease [Planctomycetes bacterium]|nr:LptF/LptG family permease [Planctomycetota bacterium]